MADFKVAYSNGTVESYSGGSATVSIDATTGVLTVLDGEGKRLRFSPAAWLTVEDEAGPGVYEHEQGDGE
ncbi:MAG TPA: hypothetical protein VK964_12465 [Nocardioidaceae bacterium]|nr:hypothetical protein [Nocardioidaceae bacterium]